MTYRLAAFSNRLWSASRDRQRALFDWPAITAFLLPLLLYHQTLAPTIYNLDSAELTTAAATGGLVRPTGYPLYLLLGRLWSLLPAGDVGYRLNLFAAFCGAATILLAELILRRFRLAGWIRAAALGLLATAPFFWSLSLAAEVYTLHAAFVAAVILALLRWADQPSPRGLFLPALLLALSLGNHGSTLLLLPGCIWFVLAKAPGVLRRPRAWGWLAAGLAVGLLPILYLPLRYLAEPAFNYAGTYGADGRFRPVDLTTWRGLWWLVGAVPFSGQYFAYPSTAVPGELAQFGRWLAEAFLAIGLGPGLLGAFVLWRRDRAAGGLLLIIFAAHVTFFVNYRAVDKETMFLPAYLIWALWLGIGYAVVAGWLRPFAGRGYRRFLLPGLLLLPVLVALAWNWPRVDLSDDWSTRRQSEAIFATVEEDAIVIGWWEVIPALQYLQHVEGQRPDVLLINRFMIDGRSLAALVHREVARRPIYIDNPPLQLDGALEVVPDGRLFRLLPAANDGPEQ